jgi:hypothetical protein
VGDIERAAPDCGKAVVTSYMMCLLQATPDAGAITFAEDRKFFPIKGLIINHKAAFLFARFAFSFRGPSVPGKRGGLSPHNHQTRITARTNSLPKI